MEEQPKNQSVPESGWSYNQEQNGATVIIARPSGTPVSWTASEYVARHKTASWYVLLGVGGLVVAGIVYYLTQDKVSTVTIVLVAGLLGVAAVRKPQTLQYAIDDSGITVAKKQYPFSLFKSYSLLPEGGLSSIVLMPLKRFMPPLSIYFDPQDQDSILTILGNHLPFEERKPDAVDQLMRKIRF